MRNGARRAIFKGNKCYKVLPQPMSYSRAIAACRTELPTVNKTFLASVMSPGENGKYHIPFART